MAGTTTYYGVTYPTSTDYVKDGASAIQTVATGFDSAVAIPTYNAQTGTTYTFALTDVGKTVTASNAGASTYTIPPTASVAWPTGTTLEVTNLGAGVVTFAAGAGVTVTNTAATLAQYASAALIRTGLNAWTVTPRSGGASALTLISTTSFSAVASASLANNTFTSTYDNYLIILEMGAVTVDGTIIARLRASGTDSGTGYFYGYAGRTQANTDFAAGGNNVASWQLNEVDAGASSKPTFVKFELYSPFIAEPTSMTIQSAFMGTAGAFTAWSGGGNHNASTSYDALSFIPSAGGNITGTITVYGIGK